MKINVNRPRIVNNEISLDIHVPKSEVKQIKVYFETVDISLSGVKFKTDPVALRRLEMQTCIPETFYFETASNDFLQINGPQLNEYYKEIKILLGRRYLRMQDMHIHIRHLSAIYTHSFVTSCFNHALTSVDGYNHSLNII